MLDVPEYDMDLPYIITEDEVISETEAAWFDKELVRIAGLNKFGKPNLVRRWGVTYCDPMQADTSQIKYLDFSLHGRQFGERRHVIEIHRTPEFLRRSGRYKIINEPDDLQEFYFCKACDAELKVANDDLPPCHKCGSKRNYLRQMRTMGKGQLLQPMPSEGCYDYWLRLERRNRTYHPPDAEALKGIEALWEWEQTPLNQRNALEDADREIARRQEIQALRQQTQTRVHFGSQIIPA